MILLCVLASQCRRKVTKQKNGTEQGKVDRRSTFWIIKAIERVGGYGTVLPKEGGVEEHIRDKGAAAEGRLRSKGGQDQLFVRVIKHTPSHTHAGTARSPGELGQPSVGPSWRPGEAGSRRKGPQITVCEALRNSRIARENQSQGI